MSAQPPTDILVKLYDLPSLDATLGSATGVIIRRAMVPERHLLTDWVGHNFEQGWASETEAAYANRPISCLVAVRSGELLGFACYDATARGVFGPMGVDTTARGQGIGAALYMASLHAMRDYGYAYAVVGAAGPVGFYMGLAGGLVIPDSWPGMYRHRLTEEEGD